MNGLVDKLMREDLITSDAMIDAYSRVPRVEFVPVKFRDVAHADIPIPIGYGHIMPAPSVILAMLNALQIQKGNNVLIAGCGSGWTVALVMHILDGEGMVCAYDMSETLIEEAQKNVDAIALEKKVPCSWYNTQNCDDEMKNMQYDRIVIFNPRFCHCHLERQLIEGGRMLAPKKGLVTRFDRAEDGAIVNTSHQGLSFLPSS